MWQSRAVILWCFHAIDFLFPSFQNFAQKNVWNPPASDLRRHLSWYCTIRINHAKACFNRYYCLYSGLSGPKTKFGVTVSKTLGQMLKKKNVNNNPVSSANNLTCASNDSFTY
jgi:hypothetical protein